LNSTPYSIGQVPGQCTISKSRSYREYWTCSPRWDSHPSTLPPKDIF